MMKEDLYIIKEESFDTVYKMVEGTDQMRLKGLLDYNKKDITTTIYDRFSKEEVKKLEELIYKRMKSQDDFNSDGKVDFDQFDIENLPNPDEMDEDMLDALLGELGDEDATSFWGSDSETDGWFRRKRQVDDDMFSRDMMKSKERRRGPGKSMSGALKMMMAMAENGNAPPMVMDMSRFVKEMLFMPDEEPTSVIGSRLPAQLRADMREVFMLFLKEEMPMDVMKMQKKIFSHMAKSMKRSIKGLLPVTEDALNETFAQIDDKISNKTASNDTEERRVWGWVKNIQGAFDNEVKQNITKMLKRTQGVMMMGKSLPMMGGFLGDSPSTEDLCLVYSSYIQQQASMKDKVRTKVMIPPTVWKKKEEGIFKVELCPFSGQWFWNKVAVCSCKDSMKGMGGNHDAYNNY